MSFASNFFLGVGLAIAMLTEEDTLSGDWWLKLLGFVTLSAVIGSAFYKIAELKKELETIRTYR